MKWRSRWLRWLLVYPLLIVGGCHTLMTGSPIPLWYLEKLDSPAQVSATTEDSLVLQDGRTITLPFNKRIPHDNPLFKAAIANGIEITSEGEAFGLMWSDRFCGNDPVVWRRLRVNLSNLAGALQPDGIDDTALHPETLSFLAENKRINLSEMKSSHDRGHLTMWDGMKMRIIRKKIDYWAEQKKMGISDAKSKSGNRANYRFNIEEWLPRLHLDPNDERYLGDIITGPSHSQLSGDTDWLGPIFHSRKSRVAGAAPLHHQFSAA